MDRIQARIDGHMSLEFTEGTQLVFPFHSIVSISPTMIEEDRKTVENAVAFACYHASRAAVKTIEQLRYTIGEPRRLQKEPDNGS